MSRRSLLSLAVVALFTLGLVGTAHAAKKAEKSATASHTVTGKSSCASCDGVTNGGHAIMLTDAKGVRWVLIGATDEYRTAQAVRKEGKKMTATYSGKPTIMKDKSGKEYAQIDVTEVKVES